MDWQRSSVTPLQICTKYGGSIPETFGRIVSRENPIWEARGAKIGQEALFRGLGNMFKGGLLASCRMGSLGAFIAISLSDEALGLLQDKPREV